MDRIPERFCVFYLLISISFPRGTNNGFSQEPACGSQHLKSPESRLLRPRWLSSSRRRVGISRDVFRTWKKSLAGPTDRGLDFQGDRVREGLMEMVADRNGIGPLVSPTSHDSLPSVSYGAQHSRGHYRQSETKRKHLQAAQLYARSVMAQSHRKYKRYQSVHSGQPQPLLLSLC